jgi:hypothetical protein
MALGNQVTLRLDLVSQAAAACKAYMDALNTLSDLAGRRPYLGNFADADFAGTSFADLDAGTAGLLFDVVAPRLVAAFADAGNGGQAKQIVNQVARTL